MTRIAFVRHGLTEWNRARRFQGRTDIPLAPEGFEQAADAAARLATLGPWTRIITSPLQRAEQTAEVIARTLGLTVAGRDEDLVERAYGEAEGRVIDEVRELWPDDNYPGAETREAMIVRGLRAASALAEVDGTIAVAHGTFIRVTAEALSGEVIPRLENGAIVILDDSEGGWRVDIVSPADEAASPRALATER